MESRQVETGHQFQMARNHRSNGSASIHPVLTVCSVQKLCIVAMWGLDFLFVAPLYKLSERNDIQPGRHVGFKAPLPVRRNARIMSEIAGDRAKGGISGVLHRVQDSVHLGAGAVPIE